MQQNLLNYKAMVLSKIKYKKFFFILLSICLGCTKFEEGNNNSLQSKTKRICKIWQIEHITELNSGITTYNGFDGWSITLSKDGSFIRTIRYLQVITNQKGTWCFMGKTNIQFTYQKTGQSIIEQYTIIRLAKNELWIKNEIEEIHYIVKKE